VRGSFADPQQARIMVSASAWRRLERNRQIARHGQRFCDATALEGRWGDAWRSWGWYLQQSRREQIQKVDHRGFWCNGSRARDPDRASTGEKNDGNSTNTVVEMPVVELTALEPGKLDVRQRARAALVEKYRLTHGKVDKTESDNSACRLSRLGASALPISTTPALHKQRWF
jgi:hypothetical protein